MSDNRTGHYKNFITALYVPVQTVNRMADLKWLESQWNEITRQVEIDKVYLETYRSAVEAEDDLMKRIKEFFNERDVLTAGGITFTVLDSDHFQSVCYSRPDQREMVRTQSERTARLFDEFILDDFFFINCKCKACIAAKGDLTWTEYRMNLLEEAARELIVNPAKTVNPRVKVIIKYPNWYEHFQGLGFDLDTGPGIFDGIYTGTETRDSTITHQHLQPYLSYSILRYFDNISPGRNGGGWIDTFGIHDLDRYVEQLWLTVFAKPKEITLFAFPLLLKPLEEFEPALWQDGSTSFDHRAMLAEPVTRNASPDSVPTTIARAAGYALEQADEFIAGLGKPEGVKVYHLRKTCGEDFLEGYLGMLGIPLEIVPEYIDDERTILLTESAGADSTITDRIEQRLQHGRNVVITSGLLKILQDRGIERIVELECTDRKLLSRTYLADWCHSPCQGASAVLLPQLRYLTNDSWSVVDALSGENGSPLLHAVDYADGRMYILMIPDNPADLYRLPEAVLKNIRQALMHEWKLRIDAPAKVAFFCYDNGTFIVESFRDEPVNIHIVADPHIGRLRDIVTGEELKPGAAIDQGPHQPEPDAGRHIFSTVIRPHSFRVFTVG